MQLAGRPFDAAQPARAATMSRDRVAFVTAVAFGVTANTASVGMAVERLPPTKATGSYRSIDAFCLAPVKGRSAAAGCARKLRARCLARSGHRWPAAGMLVTHDRSCPTELASLLWQGLSPQIWSSAMRWSCLRLSRRHPLGAGGGGHRGNRDGLCNRCSFQEGQKPREQVLSPAGRQSLLKILAANSPCI